MLREEKHLTQVELPQHLDFVLLARRCAVMDHGSAAAIAHKPSPFSKSIAEILILRVHKEPLIKKADFVEGRAPQHQARAVNPINRAIDERTVELAIPLGTELERDERPAKPSVVTAYTLKANATRGAIVGAPGELLLRRVVWGS